MKLSHWAKLKGIHYMTAFNWVKNNTMPDDVKVIRMKTGTILVEQNEKSIVKKNVIYCRVSSYKQKQDLKRQIQRCKKFCLTKGLSIDKVYKEIASGMNDNRKQFWKMINENPTTIIVENKDRLTRFGYNYLDKLLDKVGCSICVINKDEIEENDLMKDMISVVTSFCCRMYGMRRGKEKSKQIKTIIAP